MNWVNVHKEVSIPDINIEGRLKVIIKISLPPSAYGPCGPDKKREIKKALNKLYGNVASSAASYLGPTQTFLMLRRQLGFESFRVLLECISSASIEVTQFAIATSEKDDSNQDFLIAYN